MEFEIARRLEKVPANVKGNSLRSIKADKDAAQMIIVADAYGDIKASVENFRMMTNCDISFRMRGKSIDVSVLNSDEVVYGTTEATTLRRHPKAEDAIGKLMQFAALLNFNSEDAMDVIAFWNKEMPLPGCSFVSLDMDQNQMRLVMKGESFNQEQLMVHLDEYKMGIVK